PRASSTAPISSACAPSIPTGARSAASSASTTTARATSWSCASRVRARPSSSPLPTPTYPRSISALARSPSSCRSSWRRKRRSELHRLALHEARQLARQPRRLADEEALEHRRAVDESEPELAYRAHQRRVAREQSVEPVERRRRHRGIKTPPALVTRERLRAPRVKAEPHRVRDHLDKRGDVADGH